MKSLHCIDQLHAQGVCNYIQTEGYRAVLHGKVVVSDCAHETVMETAAGFGLAVIDDATPEEVAVFESI